MMPGDLSTPRLRLRPLALPDERLYCSLYTDPHVMRHVAEPLAPEAARRAFMVVMEQLAADPPKACYWVIRPRDGGDALGLLACLPDRDDTGSAEVGVLLAGTAACRGYATESIEALAEAVFARPAQHRLWTRHAPGNGPALGLMRKLGFAPMGNSGSGSTPLHWQLRRQAWIDPSGPAFASPPANC